MEHDARRTALLAAPELDSEPVLDRRTSRRLAPPIAQPLTRAAQRVWGKLHPASLGRRALAPAAVARRVLVGEAASGPPRFLVRVDEFPYATSFDHPDRYGVEPSARFHEVFARAHVPYLMAIVPQLVSRPLDPTASGGRPLGPNELALIGRMASDGVEFAAHGLTHRTRDPLPRRHSELVGLTAPQAQALADDSLELLRAHAIHPRVFVPPFNRFDMTQYQGLASRFDVVCGSPETIAFLGAQPTPRWLGEAVYCPCYPPLYGRAQEILGEVQRLIATRPGTWVPVTLHLAWELDDGLDETRRLAELLAPFAAPWSDFLAAVDASRGSSAGVPRAV